MKKYYDWEKIAKKKMGECNFVLFLAIEKGNLYKEEAKENGASLILSDEEIPNLKEKLLQFILRIILKLKNI